VHLTGGARTRSIASPGGGGGGGVLGAGGAQHPAALGGRLVEVEGCLADVAAAPAEWRTALAVEHSRLRGGSHSGRRLLAWTLSDPRGGWGIARRMAAAGSLADRHVAACRLLPDGLGGGGELTRSAGISQRAGGPAAVPGCAAADGGLPPHAGGRGARSAAGAHRPPPRAGARRRAAGPCVRAWGRS
jgi:hypothetical protein